MDCAPRSTIVLSASAAVGHTPLMEIAHGNVQVVSSRIEASERRFGSDDPGVAFLRGRLCEATGN